ncbi:retinol dehydrogenase 16-like [Mytilus galloprovincialis]|uniref:retinol dehydrogenase 16-like n=1 Tax=Mytilus galloprovincialis TaxID=29158 RepID=UPI003F7BFD1B
MWMYVAISIFLWLLLKWYRNKEIIGNYGNRYIVITGCDSGFGYSLTKKLDELGFNVFAGCLTGEGLAKLKEETSSKVKPVMLDVSKTDSIERAFEFVQLNLPQNTGIWGVVNNAGIAGPVVPIEWLSKTDYENVFEVNTLGMVETTRIFLPLVLKTKGRVFNITSVAGRVAVLYGPYAVSKHAAEGYSDALRRELYKRGVSVHIIEPGCFQTRITDPDVTCNTIDVYYDKLQKNIQDYFGPGFLKQYKKSVKKGLTTGACSNIDQVINAYVHALTAKFPKHRYLVGWDAGLLVHILGRLPEWIADYIFAFNIPIPDLEKTNLG